MKNPMLAVLAALSLGLPLSAAVVPGVTATADSTFNPDPNPLNGTAPSNMVNNSGLSVPDSFTATHTPDNSSANQWHSQVGVTGNTNVDFNLNDSYNLQTIYIWQHNQPAVTDRGVQQFDILVSTDGGTTYAEVASNLNLVRSPSTSGSPVSVSAQSFGLIQNNVTHVRIHIDSNHGGAVVGLAEVKFDAIPKDPGLAVANRFFGGFKGWFSVASTARGG